MSKFVDNHQIGRTYIVRRDQKFFARTLNVSDEEFEAMIDLQERCFKLWNLLSTQYNLATARAEHEPDVTEIEEVLWPEGRKARSAPKRSSKDTEADSKEKSPSNSKKKASTSRTKKKRSSSGSQRATSTSAQTAKDETS